LMVFALAGDSTMTSDFANCVLPSFLFRLDHLSYSKLTHPKSC
jgi:hypothetical protein